MNAFGAFAFAGVGLIGWLSFSWFITRRTDERLTAARPNMSQTIFVASLCEIGVDADIAAQTYDWISAYYGPQAAPNTQDRMKDDVGIDPEDVEDFVERFFQDNGLPEPTKEEPEVLPDYRGATLSSFAAYLTKRRSELLSREALPA